MSWDYAWTLGSLTLDDVATSIVLQDEGGSGFVDSSYRVNRRDGRAVDPQGPVAPLNMVLQIVPRYTDENGAINHTDGPAGHVQENLSLIKAELSTATEVALGRTAPHIGQVRAMVKQFAPMTRGQTHNVFLLPLFCGSGSWQDAAQSSAATTAVTTSGDRRIFDPEIVFAGSGTITHTTAGGVVSTIIATAGPTFPVTISLDPDTGLWTAVDNTGADARGFVNWDQPWVLRMEPDGAQNFTGTATIRWRNRWA